MQGGMTLLTFDDMEMLKYRIECIADILQGNESKETRISWVIDAVYDLLEDIRKDELCKQ